MRGDLTGVPPPGENRGGGAGRAERMAVDDPRRGRCRQCGNRLDLPGAGGDREDGVCRACDLHLRHRGPVTTGSVMDDLEKRLRASD